MKIGSQTIPLGSNPRPRPRVPEQPPFQNREVKKPVEDRVDDNFSDDLFGGLNQPYQQSSYQPFSQPGKQLPNHYALIQQKAIDFYTITASIGKRGGEGDLIGVDTYA